MSPGHPQVHSIPQFTSSRVATGHPVGPRKVCCLGKADRRGGCQPGVADMLPLWWFLPAISGCANCGFEPEFASFLGDKAPDFLLHLFASAVVGLLYCDVRQVPEFNRFRQVATANPTQMNR